MATVALDPDRQELARRYAFKRRLLLTAQVATAGLYLGLLIATGAAIILRRWIAAVTDGAPVATVGLYIIVLWLGFAVLSFPLDLTAGWKLPRRYGLSVQTLRQWLVDHLKAEALGFALACIAAEVVYALLLHLTDAWWVAASVFYLLFAVTLAYLGPVLLLPLFYRLTPLEDPALSASLVALAQRAGATVEGVYRLHLSAKTTAANAALAGLGRTRRIIVGDTLLDQYSPEQIEIVFAHELGHHVRHDIPRFIAVQAILTTIALFLANLILRTGAARLPGYQGIADPATAPLLALVLGGVGTATAPLAHWLSRRAERAADCYALEATGKAGAFITTMIQLANQNLAVYRPPRWVEILFDDHPSIAERVAMGERFARLGRCR
ncbi:MAG TPA: M48 family metalloprotease [Chloroflexota bacterium]|nr:M48 family metalloprotease [Chloroflexota bacterium]